MSFKEVNILRKSGNLEEAFQMATADLQKEPQNIWCKRAMGWVFYEFAKKAVEDKMTNDFLTHVNEIKDLELPPDQSMLTDSLAWQIGKLLYANKVDELFLNKLFALIKNLPFSFPADQYSFMLKAFNKHALEWNGFIEFVEWWDLSNFKQEDFVEFVTDDGKKLPSAVESVYINIAKKLLNKPFDFDAIKNFIPKIAEVAKQRQNMQYPPYYHAKLLIALGDKENFMQAFLPFARKKQRNFWVWDLMSDVFETDSDEYFSCLCKSLMCGAPDKFIINVREKLAKVFVGRNMLPQAKFEYIKILDTRKNEGWSLNEKHLNWTKTAWWDTTETSHLNTGLYKSNSEVATSLLQADTPEDIACVDYVNKEKKILNFIVSKQKSGFASFKAFNIKPEIGDVLAIRFEEKTDNKSNYYSIVSINKTDKQPPLEIYKTIKGVLQIRPGNSFGFVSDIFVAPHIVKRHSLKDGLPLNGKALLTYNNKRKSWGWNVIEIDNQ